MDTSPDEAWKALVNPAWTVALKITPSITQLHIDAVTFLFERVALSIVFVEGPRRT